MQEYKKTLLSRLTVNSKFTEFIEYCIVRDDESSKQSFHKIMVHNWSYSPDDLFKTLSEYFSAQFIPIQYASNSDIMSFYTSHLNFIMKIIKQDFMFPYNRAMHNIDILFNDKTSFDCFGDWVSLEDVISNIVSNRFNEHCELDLSNFCDDQTLIQHKIYFYKLILLANFKILMLRMGKDTKTLNLSHNKLSTVPLEILNFFIKSDMISINLSYNNFNVLSDIRVSSKIQKLWLEGNPLCDNYTPLNYVKECVVKFPRLRELDGISINDHGSVFPVWRNYLPDTDKRTRMLVDKFLMLYFSHYDSYPRKTISDFYNEFTSTFSISVDKYDTQIANLSHYRDYSRNIMDSPVNQTKVVKKVIMAMAEQVCDTRVYKGSGIATLLVTFPKTIHDPNTFSVDVLKLANKALMVIVDGVFKEIYQDNTEKILQFRRTFTLMQQKSNFDPPIYIIANDIFSVASATPEQVANSFLYPLRNLNSIMVVNPTEKEKNTLTSAFSHLTHLKKEEMKKRLEAANWDVRKALMNFTHEVKNDVLPRDVFKYHDDSDDSMDYDELLD